MKSFHERIFIEACRAIIRDHPRGAGRQQLSDFFAQRHDQPAWDVSGWNPGSLALLQCVCADNSLVSAKVRLALHHHQGKAAAAAQFQWIMSGTRGTLDRTLVAFRDGPDEAVSDIAEELLHTAWDAPPQGTSGVPPWSQITRFLCLLKNAEPSDPIAVHAGPAKAAHWPLDACTHAFAHLAVTEFLRPGHSVTSLRGELMYQILKALPDIEPLAPGAQWQNLFPGAEAEVLAAATGAVQSADFTANDRFTFLAVIYGGFSISDIAAGWNQLKPSAPVDAGEVLQSLFNALNLLF